MAIDIGTVDIEYLERPDGIISKFASFLAANSIRIAGNAALGFYLKESMKHAAKDFFTYIEANDDEIAQVNAWMDDLPWKEVGYLVLAFNW